MEVQTKSGVKLTESWLLAVVGAADCYKTQDCYAFSKFDDFEKSFQTLYLCGLKCFWQNHQNITPAHAPRVPAACGC